MSLQDIPRLKEEIAQLESSLDEKTGWQAMISKFDRLAMMRNKNPTLFYESVPQSFKNKNVDILSFINAIKPAIGNEAYNYLKLALITNINDKTNCKINFEEAERIINEKKREIEQDKVNDTKELNKLRAELLKSETANPLVDVKFGYGVSDIFNADPNAIVKRISGLIVEALNDRKKSNITSNRGKLNFKKTIKNSMGHGGTPYDLYYKNKDVKMDKKKPKIYIIMDISGTCASFVPLSSTLAFSFAHALREYEIVFYSAPNPYIYSEQSAKNFIKDVKKWEDKDMLGHNDTFDFNRINTKYLMKNVKNPSVLFNEISHCTKGNTQDYVLSLIDALIPITPDNSIFISFTDFGFRHNKLVAEEVKSTKFCNYFGHFNERIFFFNLSGMFDDTTAEILECFEYSDNPSYGGTKLCSKHKVPRTNMYPLDTIHKRPENYDDWLQEVLRLVKKALI